MALSSENNTTLFTCIGDLTYSADFKIFDSEGVDIVRISTAGVETTLTPTTSYAISAITEDGFTITTVDTYSDGQLLARRNQARKQEADWEENGSFSTTTLENQLDKIVMMIQENAEQIARSIIQNATAESQIIFPTASANSVIGWNSGGTGLENKAAIDADVQASCNSSATAAIAAQAAAEEARDEAEAIAGWEVASDAEAVAGTNNTKVMTPSRVLSSINTNAQTLINANIATYPFCRITLSENINIISDETTILPFNVVSVDYTDAWDEVNYRFTPQVEGIYLINASAYFGSFAADKYYGISIYKNGAAYTSNRQSGGLSDAVSPKVTSMLYFNGSTDYIDIRVFQSSGVTREVSNWGVYTYVQCCLINANHD